jgi:glycosidase
VKLEGDTFSFTVPIRSGDQEIGARCELADGSTEELGPIVLTGRLEPRPTARITVRIEGGAVVLDGSRSEPFEVDGAAIERYTWTPYLAVGEPPGVPRPRLESGARFAGVVDGARLTLLAPPEDGEYYATLTVRDAEGRTDTSTTYFVVEDGRARAVDMMTEHPSWIDSAILYAPVHQLWGGGARAVQEHLDYLKRLGVDVLWLWPPTSRRAEGETYEIVDHFALDHEWGTPKELRSLVDHAHELGLRVLLDFVPNHTSVQHPYYQAAQRDGEGSHYWDFYDRDSFDEVTSYTEIFHNYLPNLNFANPQVRRMITEAFSSWIREFDVDGFRVDAAWGIERRAPDYWPEWRTELKRIKPDLLLLAEATAREPYYFDHGFDVGYDWTDHPGQWPWENLWTFPQEMQALLGPSLTNQGRGFPRRAIVLRFLNNNDTGERFVAQHGPKLTRVASALEFTLPGLPLLFAGDEVGLRYQPYRVVDRIPWKDHFGLREWYDGLIRLRRSLPALSSRDLTLLGSDWGSVVAYVRPAVPGGSPALVVLNFWKEAEPTFDRNPALRPFLSAGALEDALTGKRIQVGPDEPLTLRLPPYSVRVLVPIGGTS